jgi:hypothetical protein
MPIIQIFLYLIFLYLLIKAEAVYRSIAAVVHCYLLLAPSFVLAYLNAGLPSAGVGVLLGLSNWPGRSSEGCAV